MASNFDKAEKGEHNNFDNSPYDVHSIMQYGRNAFKANPYDDNPTMVYKFDTNDPLGNTQLSPIDIDEINRHYQCDGKFGKKKLKFI